MAIDFKTYLDKVLKLPTLYRALILVGINVVIIGLGWWLLVGPKYQEVDRLRTDLDNLQVTLNENRRLASDIPRFKAEKEELERRLKEALAQLPNEKEIPNLIDAISNAGEEAGLKIQLFRPVGEVPKGFYAEVPVNMSVEGRYESLYDFSVKVANLPRIVNISGMRITSKGHQGKTPVMAADFVATTFRLIPQGQNNKKK